LFLDAEKLQMCDLYGFPHVSRIFYLKGTLLRPVYDLHRFEDRFPHLYGWFKFIKEQPALQQELTPVRAFELWVEELMTLPKGKKPALRLPMRL
jgi:glutathione S-transferase